MYWKPGRKTLFFGFCLLRVMTRKAGGKRERKSVIETLGSVVRIECRFAALSRFRGGGVATSGMCFDEELES